MQLSAAEACRLGLHDEERYQEHMARSRWAVRSAAGLRS